MHCLDNVARDAFLEHCDVTVQLDGQQFYRICVDELQMGLTLYIYTKYIHGDRFSKLSQHHRTFFTAVRGQQSHVGRSNVSMRWGHLAAATELLWRVMHSGSIVMLLNN